MGHSVCLESIEGRLLCKVSFSQLSLLQRNALISRLDVKFCQSQWSMKYRSRAPGNSACFKSVSRTSTMQGFILQLSPLQRNAI